jgi:hypothetical protein
MNNPVSFKPGTLYRARTTMWAYKNILSKWTMPNNTFTLKEGEIFLLLKWDENIMPMAHSDLMFMYILYKEQPLFIPFRPKKRLSDFIEEY